MKIIGISCCYQDSAFAFFEDGIIKAEVQEESLSTNKNYHNIVINAFLWILEK